MRGYSRFCSSLKRRSRSAAISTGRFVLSCARAAGIAIVAIRAARLCRRRPTLRVGGAAPRARVARSLVAVACPAVSCRSTTTCSGCSSTAASRPRPTTCSWATTWTAASRAWRRSACCWRSRWACVPWRVRSGGARFGWPPPPHLHRPRAWRGPENGTVHRAAYPAQHHTLPSHYVITP